MGKPVLSSTIKSDAVAAVDRLGLIDRKSCRHEFEKRFSAHRMTSDYLAIYERILSEAEASKKSDGMPRAA
jgi:hypothetical protein